MKPPGVVKTLVGVVSEVRTANNLDVSCNIHFFLLLTIDNNLAIIELFMFSSLCNQFKFALS